MTRIKICGITNLADAFCAERAGAHAIGFNFFQKSARYIDGDLAAGIGGELSPELEKFGVFVNEPVESILRTIEKAGLDAVQLHGDETRAFVSELRERTNVKIIKALRVGPDFEPADAADYETDGVLLDAFVRGEFGGTGQMIDLDVAAAVSAAVSNVYLAGGLGVENVAQAVRRIHPYAVDACSRLESQPGLKDHEKVGQFIANVRAAL